MVVTEIKKGDSISSSLTKWHWFPIAERLQRALAGLAGRRPVARASPRCHTTWTAAVRAALGPRRAARLPEPHRAVSRPGRPRRARPRVRGEQPGCPSHDTLSHARTGLGAIGTGLTRHRPVARATTLHPTPRRSLRARHSGRGAPPGCPCHLAPCNARHGVHWAPPGWASHNAPSHAQHGRCALGNGLAGRRPFARTPLRNPTIGTAAARSVSGLQGAPGCQSHDAPFHF